MAGLVTLEDMLEELVGTIDDEHDIPTPADPIRELGESRYEVDATLPVEALNERLGLHLPTDAEYLTVGGLAFHALGQRPGAGRFLQRGRRSVQCRRSCGPSHPPGARQPPGHRTGADGVLIGALAIGQEMDD